MVQPVTPLSSRDLLERRRHLRRQRGRRVAVHLWRLLFVGALAGGLVWGMRSPVWLIRSMEQIRVEGNQHVSNDALRSLIPLRYPQSLLTISTRTLETELLAKAPLSHVAIHRNLFPPGLIVRVREQLPVAIAQLAPGQGSTPQVAQTVLLQSDGRWVESDRYQNLGPRFPTPKLKVIGMRSDYRQAWSNLYPLLQQSPVKISEIDWRDRNNLKLKTDLGWVHLGPHSPKIAQQLTVLEQMGNLPKHPNVKQIRYIDLQDPSQPRLQTSQPNPPAQSPSQSPS